MREQLSDRRRVVIYLDGETFDELERHLKKVIEVGGAAVSRSWLIRGLVRRWIEGRGTKPDAQEAE